jgi:hypothetical protein
MSATRLFRLLIQMSVVWLCVGTSHAGTDEEWKFVIAIPSTDWHVRTGTAKLERSGSSLRGSFVDTMGIEYQLNAKISGNRASGRVVIVGSDGGGFDMSGTYTRRTSRNISPCLWHSIQLSDGFAFFGLSRTEDKCKP